MEKLFKYLLSIREVKLSTDDDCVDRLTRQHTVIILVCFAFFVTTKQFVGQPISCWCPSQFTDSHRSYADTVCWVTSTYHLPPTEPLPSDPLGAASSSSSSRGKTATAMIGYYQWVPFILVFQAVLATVPSLVWRFFSKRSGLHLASVMDAAHLSCQASYLEIREKAIRYVVSQMDRFLLAQRDHKTGCCVRVKHFVARMCFVVGGRLYGNYLVAAYLAVKVLYLANAVGQLVLLDLFLGSEFHLFGVYVVDRLLRGLDWTQTIGQFPRVTLCEFEIRHQSRVHRYVVQCALTINLFNEKIFVFLWFWFVFLAFAVTFDLAQWLFRVIYWPGQVQYVRRQLRAFDATHRDPGVLAKFTEGYLRRDGLFIVRLIGMNMGEVVAGEVLCGLWNNYSPERRLVAEKKGGRKTGKSKQNDRQMVVM